MAEYKQEQLGTAMEELKEARKRLQLRTKQEKQVVSPVEAGVDMKDYEPLIETATDKDTRLMMGALQMKVRDLETKVLTLEENMLRLDMMFTECLNTITEFIAELQEGDTDESE